MPVTKTADLKFIPRIYGVEEKSAHEICPLLSTLGRVIPITSDNNKIVMTNNATPHYNSCAA